MVYSALTNYKASDFGSPALNAILSSFLKSSIEIVTDEKLDSNGPHLYHFFYQRIHEASNKHLNNTVFNFQKIGRPGAFSLHKLELTLLSLSKISPEAIFLVESVFQEVFRYYPRVECVANPFLKNIVFRNLIRIIEPQPLVNLEGAEVGSLGSASTRSVSYLPEESISSGTSTPLFFEPRQKGISDVKKKAQECFKRKLVSGFSVNIYDILHAVKHYHAQFDRERDKKNHYRRRKNASGLVEVNLYGSFLRECLGLAKGSQDVDIYFKRSSPANDTFYEGIKKAIEEVLFKKLNDRELIERIFHRSTVKNALFNMRIFYIGGVSGLNISYFEPTWDACSLDNFHLASFSCEVEDICMPMAPSFTDVQCEIRTISDIPIESLLDRLSQKIFVVPSFASYRAFERILVYALQGWLPCHGDFRIILHSYLIVDNEIGNKFLGFKKFFSKKLQIRDSILEPKKQEVLWLAYFNLYLLSYQLVDPVLEENTRKMLVDRLTEMDPYFAFTRSLKTLFLNMTESSQIEANLPDHEKSESAEANRSQVISHMRAEAKESEFFMPNMTAPVSEGVKNLTESNARLFFLLQAALFPLARTHVLSDMASLSVPETDSHILCTFPGLSTWYLSVLAWIELLERSSSERKVNFCRAWLDFFDKMPSSVRLISPDQNLSLKLPPEWNKGFQDSDIASVWKDLTIRLFPLLSLKQVAELIVVMAKNSSAEETKALCNRIDFSLIQKEQSPTEDSLESSEVKKELPPLIVFLEANQVDWIGENLLDWALNQEGFSKDFLIDFILKKYPQDFAKQQELQSISLRLLKDDGFLRLKIVTTSLAAAIDVYDSEFSKFDSQKQKALLASINTFFVSWLKELSLNDFDHLADSKGEAILNWICHVPYETIDPKDSLDLLLKTKVLRRKLLFFFILKMSANYFHEILNKQSIDPYFIEGERDLFISCLKRLFELNWPEGFEVPAAELKVDLKQIIASAPFDFLVDVIDNLESFLDHEGARFITLQSLKCCLGKTSESAVQKVKFLHAILLLKGRGVIKSEFEKEFLSHFLPLIKQINSDLLIRETCSEMDVFLEIMPEKYGALAGKPLWCGLKSCFNDEPFLRYMFFCLRKLNEEKLSAAKVVSSYVIKKAKQNKKINNSQIVAIEKRMALVPCTNYREMLLVNED